MSFDEMYEKYKKDYAVTGLSERDLDILYNLVGIVYYKMNNFGDKPHPNLEKVSLVEIFNKLIPLEDNETVHQFLKIPFCVHLKHKILVNNFKPNNLGYSKIEDIKNTITIVIDSWLPF
jgi:hypothetical protein